MAFLELKYYSPALGKQIAADVILPEKAAEGPFATLYLLHGMSDDHTIWQRRTSIERPCSWSAYTCSAAGNSLTFAVIRWFGTISANSSNQNREIWLSTEPL